MKIKPAAMTIFVMVLATVISGCATIVSGTNQKLTVTSQPPDATAKVDNNLSAKTPATFTLERRNDHTIEVSKEGYKSTTVLIKRTFNGMMTGNILIGGVIGGGIDAASGASNKLVPERVDLVLEPGQGYAESPKFAAQKDQDYYDKNILKPSQDRAKQDEEKKLKEAKKADSAASKGAATTNFSPKAQAASPATT